MEQGQDVWYYCPHLWAYTQCTLTIFATLFQASCPIFSFCLSCWNISCSSFLILMSNQPCRYICPSGDQAGFLYNVPGGENHFRASMNGHRPDWFKLVTWQALGKLSISALCEKYKARTPVSWYMPESMAASHKGGVFIVKKRHPHPIVSIFINFGGVMYWLSLRSKSALSARLFSQEIISLMNYWSMRGGLSLLYTSSVAEMHPKILMTWCARMSTILVHLGYSRIFQHWYG